MHPSRACAGVAWRVMRCPSAQVVQRPVCAALAGVAHRLQHRHPALLSQQCCPSRPLHLPARRGGCHRSALPAPSCQRTPAASGPSAWHHWATASRVCRCHRRRQRSGSCRRSTGRFSRRPAARGAAARYFFAAGAQGPAWGGGGPQRHRHLVWHSGGSGDWPACAGRRSPPLCRHSGRHCGACRQRGGLIRRHASIATLPWWLCPWAATGWRP